MRYSNFEEFHNKCREPVDLEKMDSIIKRLLQEDCLEMCIPVSHEDDDFILVRAMKELRRYRAKYGELID